MFALSEENFAKVASIDVLKFLDAEGVVFSAAELTSLLSAAGYMSVVQYGAGVNEGIASARWLRNQGAAWPAVLGWYDVDTDEMHPWPRKLVQWARAQGCTSGIAAAAIDD